MSQQPPSPQGAGSSQDQVLCPNCRGGNSPAAMHCQWCGVPLRAPVYSPPPGGFPPQAPPAKPQRGRRSPPLVRFIFVVIMLTFCAVLLSAVNYSPASRQGAVAGNSAQGGVPTAVALPGIGGTASVNGWTFKLTKMENRPLIEWSDFGNAFKPSGKFWLLWLDARNDENTSRSLASTITFRLLDDHKAEYKELSDANAFSMSEFARLQHVDALSAGATPRAVQHVITVFDVASDTQPLQLVIENSGLLSGEEVRFNLK